MSSSPNTPCISEAYSARPNVPSETLDRYISDIPATTVGPRNLPEDPLERLMAILDEALEITDDGEDTMLPIW
jgi:hypothetical protein